MILYLFSPNEDLTVIMMTGFR